MLVTLTLSAGAGTAIGLDTWPSVTIATRPVGRGQQWRVTADRETWIAIAAAATRLGQGVDPATAYARQACRRVARRVRPHG